MMILGVQGTAEGSPRAKASRWRNADNEKPQPRQPFRAVRENSSPRDNQEVARAPFA